MMYKKNYVVALKTNGKILREQNDRVQLPFGSEYSVFLKNLDSVRATAAITIDGQEVGTFIIPANGEIEIERFLKGNLSRGNKLKFIERTQAVEAGRGIKADDGLVRVEFKKEQIYNGCYVGPIIWSTTGIPGNGGFPTHYNGHITTTGGSLRSSGVGGSSMGSSLNMQSVNTCSLLKEASNDVGITVPGAQSDQQFQYGAYFATEPGSEVLVLHLVGQTNSTKVVAPVTVDIRPKCTTCKKHNKHSSKFCVECGTSLQII